MFFLTDSELSYVNKDPKSKKSMELFVQVENSKSVLCILFMIQKIGVLKPI